MNGSQSEESTSSDIVYGGHHYQELEVLLRIRLSLKGAVKDLMGDTCQARPHSLLLYSIVA
jgi:hypothetical protein